MRISAGLRQRGRTTERWERWRAKTKSVLAMRSRGRCEVTGMHDALDGHHFFGRTDEPWSSHPQAMAAVTRHCHEDLERELLPALHDELRWGALGALAEEFGELDWYRSTLSPDDRPLDVWRRLIDRLNGLGWAYDKDRNAITRVAA